VGASSLFYLRTELDEVSEMYSVTEFQTIDKAQKLSNLKISPSEPFRIPQM
jgi:hypothetical protein